MLFGIGELNESGVVLTYGVEYIVVDKKDLQNLKLTIDSYLQEQHINESKEEFEKYLAKNGEDHCESCSKPECNCCS